MSRKNGQSSKGGGWQPLQSGPALKTGMEPRPSFSTLILDAIVGLVIPLAGLGSLIWKAQHRMTKADEGPYADLAPLGGSDFASLAWALAFYVAIAFGLASWKERRGVLAWLALSGQLLFVSALLTLSLAWGAGKQNYWDAYHFVALVWSSAIGAGIAVASSIRAGRAGSEPAKLLQGSAWVCVGILVLGWLWTWSPWIQGLEGWIARALFLATHG